MTAAPTDPILITGGTGFLGSHLVEVLLSTGRKLTIVSRQPRPELAARGIRVVVGALHDPAVCADAVRDAGTVFHVAARVGVWGRYEDFYRDNVIATKTLLTAAQNAGVKRFVHTSTPSVVYNGQGLAGADESLPLTTSCPSAYPLTKAIAERAVLAVNRPEFLTTALRPHLIWGLGDPHLVPRILARARAGRLRIVGDGQNRVDMVHITNATAAHLAVERALAQCNHNGYTGTQNAGIEGVASPSGRAYFITNDEPVHLWEWINELLVAVGEPPLTKRISLAAATRVGAVCEGLWRVLPLKGEPPMTRFVAAELAKDHWFDISAAKRDLGYRPTVSMAEGTAELIAYLKR
ncbi:NAD-dependent epimerase/dehydratase family protein [Synoicihabitans lomoniglobus]|uniref:NAD-dependent epimerase/dehydratase family protein n=1 Tax=Synoicihabitans lomoniglobus TaxID=2909285 RepID=A0AAF0CNF9_9BACT|nr:NAD-dependent epimerase/dehydratase family protein [Opitutaceae bacterium LMO-M01]WED64506.1 NAD-dependent epimerase/dehydratase family protein [Opitutaceae bacterium LMO-M01]